MVQIIVQSPVANGSIVLGQTIRTVASGDLVALVRHLGSKRMEGGGGSGDPLRDRI